MSNEFYKILFDESESSSAGSLYSSEVIKMPPIDHVEFFCINPLDSNIDHDFKASKAYSANIPRRANLNISKFRNFLFEMDNVPLDTQLEILSNCGIPWSTIVYSGGKSYHAILSLKTPLETALHTSEGVYMYKQTWKRLKGVIDAYIALKYPGQFQNAIDTAVQNPSRLSRAPNHIRDGLNLQKIIHLGQRVEELTFQQLLSKVPEAVNEFKGFSPVIDLDFKIESLQDFWRQCPKGLYNLLRYCDWAASAGMYPLIFKYTIWAVESTGVSYDILLQAYKQFVFPKLVSVGYPEEKLALGIKSAYNKLAR